MTTYLQLSVHSNSGGFKEAKLLSQISIIIANIGTE